MARHICYWAPAAAFLIGQSLAFSILAAELPDRPLRVLYVGEIPQTGRGTNYSLLPGQSLAPEAIYFDHRDDPASLTPGYLKHFDAVVLAVEDAKIGAVQQRAINDFAKSGRSVKKLGTNAPADDARLRIEVLAGINPTARKEWEAFVAGRAPLKYEPREEVANYERRPQTLAFQLPLSARDSMKYTQVPADFELRLFAGEPDIVRPIAFAWDERGRLWVVETPDYPHGLVPDGTGNDTIKICEDTNGDGRADKFTVFADKLNIPTSMVFANGGVILSQAPHFLFLKDTNGDDKADVRQVLFEGCWGTGDTHAGPSSLAWGFDNWLYGTVGYAAFRQTVDGQTNRFAQGVYRFRADGSAIEFLHQFNNNTWGFGQNAAGDVFGSTANNNPTFFGTLPATLTPAGQQPGRGQGRGRGFPTAKSLKPGARMHPNTPNIRQVDAMGGYTAAAGHTFIYSDMLPERLQGKAMVCEPTCKLIGLFEFPKDGAGYAAEDKFNIIASADEWMSPVFSDVGPDGAIWVADWYNFIIQHNPTPNVQRAGYQAQTGRGGAHLNPLRDNTRGRIYRVVWKDAPARPARSLAGANTAALVDALDSDNKFWRLTTQRLLVDGKKSDAVPALKTMVKSRDGRPGAIHALWTLHGLGALDRDTHHAALLAKDSALRRNAVRALGRDEAARRLFFESGLINDPDLTTRLAAFIKLAEFGTTPEIQTVVGQLRRDQTARNDELLNRAGALLASAHQVAESAETEEKVVAGDVKRGEDIFRNHAVAACSRCHSLRGEGGVVGPALDGIAARKDEAYILESLTDPNAKMAEGFTLPVSPMPPVGLLLREQELADLKAYLLTLKAPK